MKSNRVCVCSPGVAFCVVTVVAFAHASTKESVRAELIRLQKQTGLSLVFFGGGGGSGHLDVVIFNTRHLAEKQLVRENVGEGAVASDGSAIAFELRRKTGRTFSLYDTKNVRRWKRALCMTTRVPALTRLPSGRMAIP